MKKIIFIITFIIFLFIANSALAQSKILINEFLIDPQPQSVEIFNSGTESADISNWIIDDSGGTTFYTIPKNNIVFSNQCLVFSGDFNLNKTSADTVRLINSSQQLIDSFFYKSSSGSGVSYYRFPDNANYWTIGSSTLGFYNQTNVSCLVTPTLTPTLIIMPTITITTIPTEIPMPTSILTPQSYDNIYLSEVMVNPAAGESEWVEIYNNNDFPVSLNNWYIDDLENAGSSPKIFSLEINAKGYGIFDLTSSIFNNDGDSVRLLDFNKNLKDDFEYGKTEQGKTLGRISFDSDDFCLQEPSKNSINNPCIDQTPTLIMSAKTEQKNMTPTINKTPIIPISKANNFDVSIHRSINYPTGVVLKNYNNGEVLGLTNELIINSDGNKSLINLMSIIAFSYSLLTIISILFKMKLFYGKNKNFYSLSLHSS